MIIIFHSQRKAIEIQKKKKGQFSCDDSWNISWTRSFATSINGTTAIYRYIPYSASIYRGWWPENAGEIKKKKNITCQDTWWKKISRLWRCRAGNLIKPEVTCSLLFPFDRARAIPRKTQHDTKGGRESWRSDSCGSFSPVRMRSSCIHICRSFVPTNSNGSKRIFPNSGHLKYYFRTFLSFPPLLFTRVSMGCARQSWRLFSPLRE